MRRIRGWLFAVLFYGVSVGMVLLAPLPALLGRAPMVWWTHLWARLHRGLARAILGIESRFEGSHPAGPVLYAAKHQAMFETLELALTLDAPAIVMKRELARIPIWGWCARRYGVIAVDRDASGGALRGMMREAQAALDAGRSILIFPEGTRVLPGESPPLRAGFAGLYRLLGLPVVPVALDSGRAWPRHAPPRPGIVTFRYGEPIPAGLKRVEAEARVHAAINALERLH